MAKESKSSTMDEAKKLVKDIDDLVEMIDDAKKKEGKEGKKKKKKKKLSMTDMMKFVGIANQMYDVLRDDEAAIKRELEKDERIAALYKFIDDMKNESSDIDDVKAKSESEESIASIEEQIRKLNRAKIAQVKANRRRLWTNKILAALRVFVKEAGPIIISLL